jgi:three-Cys-motif partner protein
MTIDSDPRKWDYKIQTRTKHALLGEYLKGWLPILGRPDAQQRPRTLHYIDGFAGRGRYNSGEEGSPIVAMRVLQNARDSSGLNTRVQASLVEIDDENHAALEQEIHTIRTSNEFPAISVSMQRSDFQTESARVLGLISPEEAVFVFIDPFGYDCIDMDFIRRLLSNRKTGKGRIYTELFINVMMHFINWKLDTPNMAENWDRVFGTTEWRALIGHAHRRDALVELYVKQVQLIAKEMGASAFVFPIGVKPEERDAELYYLIHVSFDVKAREVMDKAASKVPEVQKPQLQIFELSNASDAIAKIARDNPDITYDQMLTRLWLENPSYRLHDHVKPALATLEKDQTITVTPIPNRKRRGGFNPEDMIRLTRS